MFIQVLLIHVLYQTVQCIVVKSSQGFYCQLLSVVYFRIFLGKAGEQFDPTHIADNETSPNDNDQVVSELNTEKEEKPKKRGRGRPRRTGANYSPSFY